MSSTFMCAMPLMKDQIYSVQIYLDEYISCVELQEGISATTHFQNLKFKFCDYTYKCRANCSFQTSHHENSKYKDV
jgi:hypothetical protein